MASYIMGPCPKGSEQHHTERRCPGFGKPIPPGHYCETCLVLLKMRKGRGMGRKRRQK